MATADAVFPRGDTIIWTLARRQLTGRERGDAAGRLAALIDAGVPADRLVTALAGHGLVPLAYRHLVASGARALPDALEIELAREFRRHAVSRFRFACTLRSVIAALESADIPVVPFKGPALAVQLYGNYAMRQYGDLDLLVEPSRADDARDVLTAAGFVTRAGGADAEWERYLRRTRHSFELRQPATGLLIELHWSIADRFHGVDLDPRWLMQDSAVIDLLGRQIRVMQGARLLLAQCMHGAKHLWERMIWLAEIAAIIEQAPDLDWKTAFAEADRRDLGRSLRACLLLTRHRFGIAPPGPWLAEMERDTGARRLAAALDARLAVSDPARDRLVERFRLGYQARGSAARRAAFCWNVATHLSERDAGDRPAPPRFPALHGLRRALRLARAARAERRTR